MDVCRNELGYHPVNVYLNITCAMCYFYTFHTADPDAYPLTYNYQHSPLGYLVHDSNLGRLNYSDVEFFLPAAHDRLSPVYKVAFPSSDVDRDADVWNQCCQAAASCCEDQLRTVKNSSGATEDCPPTWDGWQCWQGASKSETVRGHCPSHISLHALPTCSSAATKTCTKDGNWLSMTVGNSDGNISKEWTDYTACLNLHSLEYRLQVQIVAYCISIAFLVPALLIFWKFQHLQVQRNLIHVNFFMSLLLYAIVLIVFHARNTNAVLDNPDAFVTADESVWECRILYTMTMYFRLCNYCLMFCEGLFLLRHLKHVFMREQHFFMYAVCGWGLPLIPVSTYTAMRYEEPGCWITVTNEALEWILKGPALVSLGLNLVILIYIVCLLVKKLESRYVSEMAKISKSLRAVLVLMPLFGLHFIITAYRPPNSCNMQWYFYLNSILDGLQGFFVAITFCYTNNEVIAVLKKYLRMWRIRHGKFTRSDSNMRSLSTVTRSSPLSSLKSTSSGSRKSSKSPQTRLCRFESLITRQASAERKELLRHSNSSPLDSAETGI